MRSNDVARRATQRILPTWEGVLPSALSRSATIQPAVRVSRGSSSVGRLPVAALLSSAVVLSAVAAGPNTLSLDLRVTQAVQTLDSNAALQVAALGNALGSTVGIVLAVAAVAVILLVARRWWDLALVLAALGLTRGNWLLKHAFSSPRPSATEVEVRDPAAFYGFPSGHTSATVLLVGVTLVILWPLLRTTAARVAVALVGSMVVIGVGFARVFSGAHWPSDVLGGVLWGVLGVVALVALRDLLQRRWHASRFAGPTVTTVRARRAQTT